MNSDTNIRTVVAAEASKDTDREIRAYGGDKRVVLSLDHGEENIAFKLTPDQARKLAIALLLAVDEVG